MNGKLLWMAILLFLGWIALSSPKLQAQLGCGDNFCAPGDLQNCPEDCQFIFCGDFICEDGEEDCDIDCGQESEDCNVGTIDPDCLEGALDGDPFNEAEDTPNGGCTLRKGLF